MARDFRYLRTYMYEYVYVHLLYAIICFIVTHIRNSILRARWKMFHYSGAIMLNDQSDRDAGMKPSPSIVYKVIKKKTNQSRRCKLLSVMS
jgi:hypothetical protein